MKNKMILLGILLVFLLVFLSGCAETDITKIECEDRLDCEYEEGMIKKCAENKCIYQECFDEYDCNGFSANWRKCAENKCVDLSPECERIATIDYGYKNPECEYSVSDECLCKDMKLVRYRQEIERNNSVEKIRALWEFDDFIVFEIIEKVGDK